MNPIYNPKHSKQQALEDQAKNVEVLYPESCRIIRALGYAEGVRDTQDYHDAHQQQIIDDQSKLIERLTAKMNVLSNENRQLKTTIREVNPNEE
jgi:hypothetical protein